MVGGGGGVEEGEGGGAGRGGGEGVRLRRYAVASNRRAGEAIGHART